MAAQSNGRRVIEHLRTYRIEKDHSGGNVTLAAGITTSSGNQTLPTGQAAELRAFTDTGGNVVFAGIARGGAPA